MFAVKKNVPIPQPLRTVLPSRRKYPFDQMDVGDHFFVPNRTKNTLATHASTVGKQLGRKFVTRLHYAYETEEGWEPCTKETDGAVLGIGVWRDHDNGEALLASILATPEPVAVTTKPKRDRSKDKPRTKKTKLAA